MEGFFEFDDGYVRRLRDGDPSTWEHFVRYFSRLLLLKLRRSVKSMADIDDIRQDVYSRLLKILRSDDGIREGAKLGKFVNTMCNNIVHEYHRGSWRREPIDDQMLETLINDIFDDPVVLEETKEDVRATLSEMQPRDADILRALFLQERDRDEICRDLRIESDYLRVLLHRAKERFREVYRARKWRRRPPR